MVSIRRPTYFRCLSYVFLLFFRDGRALLVDGNDSSSEGEANEFGLGMKVEFMHKVRAMSFSRAAAYS